MFLGGCECHELMSRWPRWPTPENIKLYYMIQLGHHVHSIVELFTGLEKRADVPEMLLHHVATVAAMLFSYFGNQIPSGVTVLVAHNIGDIFLNLGKFTRDLKLLPSILEAVLYVILLITWFVPRVVMITSCFLYSGYYVRYFWPQNFDPVITKLR